MLYRPRSRGYLHDRGQMLRSWVRVEAHSEFEEDSLIYSQSEPERAVGKSTTCFGTRALGLLRNSVLEGQTLFQKTKDGRQIEITKIEAFAAHYKDA